MSPILNTKGDKIGEASFVGEGIDGVTINIQAEGLSPGKHGVHIHEMAVCTPPDLNLQETISIRDIKNTGLIIQKGFI